MSTILTARNIASTGASRMPREKPKSKGRVPKRAASVATPVIRQATAADIPFILRLYAMHESSSRDVLEVKQAVRIWRRFAQYPNYKLYVVRIRKQIVGTFALLIMDNLAHRGAPSGVVEDVIVDAKYHRHGIGRKMMTFALDRCQAAGCYKMALSSNLKRRGAHRFYRALGFEKHGYSFRVEL